MTNGKLSSDLNEVNLKCEHCGSEWLHQEHVEIYKGPEDWYHMRVVCDKSGQVTIGENQHRNNSRNPSPRLDQSAGVAAQRPRVFTNLQRRRTSGSV